MLRRGNAIGRLLHYTKNSLSSPCTTQHKHEQKDRTKTLAESPDHIEIDFECYLYAGNLINQNEYKENDKSFYRQFQLTFHGTQFRIRKPVCKQRLRLVPEMKEANQMLSLQTGLRIL